MERLYLEWAGDSLQTSEAWTVAVEADSLPAPHLEQVVSKAEPATAEQSPYWQFSDDARLVCLPSVAETEREFESSPTVQTLGEVNRAEEDLPEAGSTAEVFSSPDEFAGLDVPMPEPEAAPETKPRARAIEVPAYDELSREERHLLNVIEHETLTATTGVLTDAKLDQECREKIAAAYKLNQRGAAYAARKQLIEVLRLISQAKDARESTRSRSESLAAGLRALDEAEDFAPRGSQLEAEMRLDIVCAAHRTPLARELDLTKILPSQMMERYNRYAQIKLAVAVAGEPAGSMALYSLGKLNSQLGATEAEHHPHATRRAVAFQQAALLAHNENYLAAHELGVLLAETGHFPEAQHLLSQVAAEQPNAVVYRNLARVQDEMGRHQDAQSSRTKSQLLAQQGRGPRQNVNWVSQQEFSRDQMNTFTTPAPQVANRAAAPAQAAPTTVWR
jgi:tetratricopeptide (TPR) repeat protein